jgi:hypothetical protein
MVYSSYVFLSFPSFSGVYDTPQELLHCTCFSYFLLSRAHCTAGRIYSFSFLLTGSFRSSSSYCLSTFLSHLVIYGTFYVSIKYSRTFSRLPSVIGLPITESPFLVSNRAKYKFNILSRITNKIRTIILGESTVLILHVTRHRRLWREDMTPFTSQAKMKTAKSLQFFFPPAGHW